MMSRAGEPEMAWHGYSNVSKVFRDLNRCGCGRLKTRTARRCRGCKAKEDARLARGRSR